MVSVLTASTYNLPNIVFIVYPSLLLLIIVAIGNPSW